MQKLLNPSEVMQGAKIAPVQKPVDAKIAPAQKRVDANIAPAQIYVELESSGTITVEQKSSRLIFVELTQLHNNFCRS